MINSTPAASVRPASVRRCVFRDTHARHSALSKLGRLENRPVCYSADATLLTWGGDRWQRPRCSHRLRRRHKRASAGRAPPRERPRASAGRPPLRRQRQGSGIRLRAYPKRPRAAPLTARSCRRGHQRKRDCSVRASARSALRTPLDARSTIRPLMALSRRSRALGLCLKFGDERT